MVVAHRGASWDVAEHTLAAYVAAIESGADALECDVRLTRDGYLVCVHDRTVNRTSNGSGLVSEFDLARLAEMDFVSWRAEWPTSADQLLADDPYLRGVVPDREPGGGVLTLATLLGLVHDASRPIRLLIETKHPTRYSGLVEQELVRQLAHFGWAGRPGSRRLADAPLTEPSTDRVDVMSFAPIALRRVRLLAPDVRTVLLLDRLLPRRRDGALPIGVRGAGPGLPLLQASPGYVERAHARGHLVYTWTVDDPSDMDFVIDLGVDAMITNRPTEVLRRLGPVV
jgi:glycerophosphoryl diester phosphodiesterase